MNAILLASAGVVLLLVGGGIGFWAGRSGVGGSKARVEKAEAELDEYKRSVTEHFGQTAAHFQAIGKQYRELYEHMASGAQALCDHDEAGQQLLFAPGTNLPSNNEQDSSAEAATDATAQRPVDDAGQPAADEAADAARARADEQETVIAEKADSDAADEPVAEAAAEPQREAGAEAEERTIH